MPLDTDSNQWIDWTGTHEISDDSGASSVPSEDAVHIDDTRSTGGPNANLRAQQQRPKYINDDVPPGREGRVHEKIYEQSSGQKFGNKLVLSLDRMGERWGLLVDRIGELWKDNRLCALAMIAACLLIVVGLTAVTVSVVTNKNASEANQGDGSFDFTYVEDTKEPISTITEEPTTRPTLVPTTSGPTLSSAPSRFPSKAPSFKPSASPTGSPTISAAPTISPAPTVTASASPTYYPTEEVEKVARQPVIPFSKNETEDSVLTFCVIADAPYNQDELKALPGQIATQMEGCEFLVHLGDIFIGDTPCAIEDYQTIHDIMIESHAPAFLVPGDNEWNDCIRSEIDVGWNHWTNHFVGFENNWNHTFSVARQPGYESNFYFIEKQTLVIGLNIVGGRVHNATEWKTRLRSEYEWVRKVMLMNLVETNTTDGVILMAHAHPSEDHREFFNAFRVFLRDELKNEFPVLYLHGDGHDFMYTPNYHNQSNFLRIQHEGGTNEPVLKIKAAPRRGSESVRSFAHNAFQFDRQLGKFPVTEKAKNKDNDK